MGLIFAQIHERLVDVVLCCLVYNWVAILGIMLYKLISNM